MFQVADRIAVLYLGTAGRGGPGRRSSTAQSAVDLMTTGASTRLGNGTGAERADAPGVSTGAEG